MRKFLLVVLVAVFTSLNCYGGDLEPMAAPGPTMKPLSIIEPRGAIKTLPVVIDEAGSYYLTDNMVISEGESVIALDIQADNVTVDMNGYTISKTLPADGVGINIGSVKNIAISNGAVKGFASGIVSSDGEIVTVNSVKIFACGGNGISLLGGCNIVNKCIVNGCGGVGLKVGDSSEVSDNICRSNSGKGIVAGAASLIRGNSCSLNGDDGIESGGCSQVRDNISMGNSGSGYMIAGDGTIVSKNSAGANAKSGIETGDGSIVKENISDGNNTLLSSSYAGLKIGQECLVQGNECRRNSKYNIYVDGVNNCIEHNLILSGTGYGIYFKESENYWRFNYMSNNNGEFNGNVPTLNIYNGTWDRYNFNVYDFY